jgi:addiction module HigA family antidote
LKGHQAGRYSLRIDDQYRVTFRWEQGMPTKSASKTITRDSAWIGPAIPPGEILLEEFLKPLGMGQVEAARQLGISLNRLNEIVLGKRGISADTALRLARLLKTSAQFWMHLQADWDLHVALRREARHAS